MKKINKKNVVKLIVLIGSLGLVIYDLFMILIYPVITGKLTGWTSLGFATFIISLIVSISIIEQIKSVPTVQRSTL